MYNSTLYKLMKKFGKVAGLKAVSSACKRYSDDHYKEVVYIAAHNKAYYRVYAGSTKSSCIIDENMPLRMYMEDRAVVHITGEPSMLDLYRAIKGCN